MTPRDTQLILILTAPSTFAVCKSQIIADCFDDEVGVELVPKINAASRLIISIVYTSELIIMSALNSALLGFHSFIYLSLDPLSKSPFGNSFKVLMMDAGEEETIKTLKRN